MRRRGPQPSTVPQVEDREIPFYRALEADKVPEERRLFYVGLTRAKRELYVTWSRRRARSRFLDELFPTPARARATCPSDIGREEAEETASPGRFVEFASSGGVRLSPDTWLPDWMRDED